MRRDETRWGQKKKEGTNAKKDRWMRQKGKRGHREDNENIRTKVWTEETKRCQKKTNNPKGRENNKKNICASVHRHLC